MSHIARYFHDLEDGRIQCDVCPRECKLNDGQRGLCFVRKREEDNLVLTTYGRSSGFCIDPVEKKPLNHFYPGTPTLSFGTAGCNLTCHFCQNWDISKSREMDRLMDEASPEKIARVANELGCRSVAFTYNDPVIFLEYAIDIAKECHRLDIKTIVVSAGYIQGDARRDFFTHMDAANIDLKGFTDRFYSKLCSAELQSVLDTLTYLKHQTEVWFEITTLLIPGENDSPEEIEALSDWIVTNLGTDVPLHFTAFHPDFRMLDKPATPQETLLKAREIALKKGVAYVYVGNVHNKSAASTYCFNCGEILIGRDWYVLSEWNVEMNGHCSHCQAVLPGRFDPSPGEWGSKRMPINLSSRQ